MSRPFRSNNVVLYNYTLTTPLFRAADCHDYLGWTLNWFWDAAEYLTTLNMTLTLTIWLMLGYKCIQRLIVDHRTLPVANAVYSGPWFQADETAYDTTPFGPPLQSTLRGTNANAVLSYVFSGTQVVILGTSKISNTTGGQSDPSWSCLIDGVGIPSRPGNTEGSNNWILCENYQLTDGQHNITLQVTVLNQTTFWFDHIQYAPSVTVPLGQALVAVQSKDLQIQYTPTSSWNEVNGIVEIAVDNGSKMTFDFIGTSLRWIGLIPTGYPLTATTATYVIDSGNPVAFNVPASMAGSGILYNQLFFQTPQLSPGQHRIEVVHGGNSQTTPLTLETLLIQNATAATPTTSTGAAPSSGLPSASGPSNSVTSSRKRPIGALVGGVIGGVFLILMALLFILIRILRRRAKAKSRSRVDAFQDSGVVEPFLPPFSGQAVQPNTSEKRPEIHSVPSGALGLPNRPAPNRNNALTPPPTPPLLASNAASSPGSLINFHGSIPSTDVASGASRIVRHEDSGVRIPSRAEEGPLELPPLYSSG